MRLPGTRRLALVLVALMPAGCARSQADAPDVNTSLRGAQHRNWTTQPSAQFTPDIARRLGMETPEQVAAHTVEVQLMGFLEVEDARGNAARTAVPAREVKPGVTERLPLGDRDNGALITYRTAPVTKEGEVPVTITLRLWGRRNADTRFVARMRPFEGRAFRSATAEGAQLKLTLSLTPLGPMTPPPEPEPAATRPATRPDERP